MASTMKARARLILAIRDLPGREDEPEDHVDLWIEHCEDLEFDVEFLAIHLDTATHHFKHWKESHLKDAMDFLKAQLILMIISGTTEGDDDPSRVNEFLEQYELPLLELAEQPLAEKVRRFALWDERNMPDPPNNKMPGEVSREEYT